MIVLEADELIVSGSGPEKSMPEVGSGSWSAVPSSTGRRELLTKPLDPDVDPIECESEHVAVVVVVRFLEPVVRAEVPILLKSVLVVSKR